MTENKDHRQQKMFESSAKEEHSSKWMFCISFSIVVSNMFSLFDNQTWWKMLLEHLMDLVQGP